MGILDEAIREHLELKRQHGADDSELKQLEDQAFGQAERPGAADPAAEAPTEFMAQPDLGEGDGGGEEPTAVAEPSAPAPEAPQPAAGRREPAAGLADLQEAPERATPPPEPAAEEPEEETSSAAPVEEPSAAEHEAIPSPPSGSHTTAERHAIADQPTEMFDVEKELASPDAAAPPDEDLVAEEMTEARLGPAEPEAPLQGSAEDEEDDDFFDEQRLSDELDQALEAPSTEEPEPASEEPASEEHEAISEEHEAISEEHEAVANTDEPDLDSPPTEIHELPPRTDEQEAVATGGRDSDEDVLEDTPDFLEESPEDDQLWFEQKPPKDFDFDD
jgi:hypothetical protein